MTNFSNLMKKHFVPLSIAAVGAVLSTLFHFWSWLDGAHSFSINQDNTYYLHPIHHYISEHFNFFDMPMRNWLWNVPIFHLPMFSMYYPFYFLWADVWSTPEAAVINGQYVIVFHVAIFGMGMAILTYALGVRHWMVIIAAAVLVSSSEVRMIVPWLWWFASYAWLPWVLTGIVLVLEGKRPFLGVMVASSSFAMSVMAQPNIHVVYFSAVIIIGWAINRYKYTHNIKELLPKIYWFGLFTILAILFSGEIFWMPLLHGKDYIRWSSSGPIVGSFLIPFKDSLLFPATLSDLLNVLMPTKERYAIGNSFLGPFVVYLVMYGTWSRWKTWYVPPLAFLCVYSLLSTTGKTFGLAYVNYLLPMLGNSLRELPAYLAIFAVSSAVLAALGLNALIEDGNENNSIFNRFDRFVLPVLAVLLGLAWFQHGRVDAAYFAVYSITAFLVLKLGLRYKLPTYVMGPALSILVILIAKTSFVQFCEELPNSSNPSLPQNWPYRHVLEQIGSEVKDIKEYRIRFDFEHGKVADHSSKDPRMLGAQSVYFGIPTFTYYMSPMPYDNFRYYIPTSWDTSRRNYVKLFGGKYLLTDKNSPDKSYKLVRSWQNAILYSTEDALPKQRLVNREVGTYRSFEEFKEVIERTDNYKSGVYLPVQEAGKLRQWLPGAGDPGSVERINQGNNRIAYHVQANTASLLVINEHFEKAWRVNIDGQLVEPVVVNIDQIAIPVGPGNHNVDLTYYPWDFMWANQIQLISIIAAMFLVLFLTVIRMHKLIHPPVADTKRKV